MSYRMIVINPGSTSTKAAYFEDDAKIISETIRHPGEELAKFDNVADQYELRMEHLGRWLDSLNIELKELSAVIGRGAPLKPLEGGSYSISEKMLSDLRSMKYSNHASNLGAIIASQLGRKLNIPALISDPITVDNFKEISRVSGVPEIERKCRVHALNIKEVCRRDAKADSQELEDVNFVCAHMGGGVSVAALEKGKVIDVNDALLGMGPFSPDRAGALPIGGLVKLCYSGEYTEQEMIDKLSKKSGLVAYLGSSDLREVEKMIDRGDSKAELYFNAMAYQIAKEIGIAAVALSGNYKKIILTGGMANSVRLTNEIKKFCGFLGDIKIVAGEFEMEALAAAGVRFLSGIEKLKDY